MKPRFRNHRNALLLALPAAAWLSSSGAIHAQTNRYWDPSGGGNFGGVTTTDYWVPNSSLIWSGSNTGATSRLNLLVTTGSDAANFGGIAGTAGQFGGGTIPVGFVNVGAINFNNISGSFTVTLGGGVINLAAAATLFAQDPDSPGNPVTGSITSSLRGAGTSLTKTGADTIILSGFNTHTGSTVVSAGFLTLSNSLALQNSVLNAATSITGDASNGLRASVPTLTLGGLSGDKDLASLFTTTSGDYGTVTALTLNPGATQEPVYLGALSDGAAAMSVIKTGAGTQSFAGANTYTGGTSVLAGVLELDYLDANNSKLADASVFTLGSGVLRLRDGSHIEVVGSTTLTGAGSITRTSGSAVLALGAISGTGSVNFGAANIATTTRTNDSSGILGGFATLGGTNWARNNGSGSIVAYTAGHTDIAALGSTIANAASANVRILANGAGGSIALGATTTTINTLLQANATTAATVDTSGRILAVSGIMLAETSEALTLGVAAGDGALIPAVSGGTLSLHNFSPTKALTLNGAVANHTTASGLAIGGPGTVVLAGANSHTGVTTLGGGAVSLTGSLTGSSLVIGGAATLSQSPTGTIAGAASLTLASTGTSILSGANSYNGDTTITSGILIIENSSALGATDAGTTVASGAALQLQGDLTVGAEPLSLIGIGVNNTGALRSISGNNVWGGAITLGSAARIAADAGSLTLDVDSGNAITSTNQALAFSGAGNITVADPIVIGTGALQKEGTGTLTLAAANTVGMVDIVGGAVNVQHPNALGNTTLRTMVGTGGSLQIQGGLSIGEPIFIGSTGTGGIGGLRNISGDNTFSGVITFMANSRFNSDSGTLTLSNTLAANGVAFTAPAISFGGLGDIIVSGNINPHSATLLKDGSGTLTLTGAANTYGSTAAGTTTISAGTLRIGGAGRLNSGASVRNIVNNATFNFNSSADQSLAGVISGSGAIIHDGSGTLTLTGANTITGDITVENGTLVGAGGTNSPGVTVFGSRDNTRTITVNSGGILRFDSGNILGANHVATTAPTLVINSGGTVTNAAPASNNAINNVELNGGTLTSTTGHQSSSEPFLAVYGAWNLNGGVTATGNSAISTSDPVRGGVMLKSTGDKTTDFNVVSGTLTVSAPLIDNLVDSNIGSLNKSGAGGMVISGANTYTGTTTVSAGTLALGANNVLPDASNIILGGGTLDAATFTDTAGTLDVTAAATINLGSGATLAFANSSAANWTGGTLNITGTFVPGSSLRFGTNGSGLTASQLGNITAAGFTGFALAGDGFLTATPASGSPYEIWAGPGVAFGGDANGDGVSNGLAFLLGAANPSVNAAGLLPTVTQTGGGLVMAFSMRNAATRGSATLSVEHSSDLGSGDPWMTVLVPATSGGPTGGVTFTVTPGSPLNTVTATISSSEAAAGKLFGRLKAVNP